MMDVVVERCAGLDVHRDSVVATVRVPGTGKSRRRREQRTRSFGTTIGQLETLADWLADFGVTLVGMEATGVYWKPVFYVLGGAVLALYIAMMLRRGAPLTPGVTTALGTLAVTGLANVGACFSHPHPSAAVVLVWHGLTIAALVGIG